MSLNDTRSIIATTNTKLEGVQANIAALTDKLNFWSSTINDNVVSLNDTRSIIVVTNEKLDGILKALPSSGSGSSVDLSPVITSIDAVGMNIRELDNNFSVNLDSLVDKLSVVIEGTLESIENRVNVSIEQTNNAYNVFYVTGEDGTTQPVSEFAGDLTSASGKLLSMLYRLVFSDALSNVDSDLGDFEDFFTSTEPEEDSDSYAVEGMVNVWSAS